MSIILVKTQEKTGGGCAVNRWNLFDTEEAYQAFVEDRAPYVYFIKEMRIAQEDVPAVRLLLDTA